MNEEIIGFDALYESMTKCIKGVRWKDSVAHYHLNAIEETLKLEKELHEGTYKPRKPKEFTIYAPKRRDILSVSFRDLPERERNRQVPRPAGSIFASVLYQLRDGGICLLL